MDKELESLCQTVFLCCLEIENISKEFIVQCENLRSAVRDYCKTVNEMLELKNKDIAELKSYNARLRASLLDDDTQILEESQ